MKQRLQMQRRLDGLFIPVDPADIERYIQQEVEARLQAEQQRNVNYTSAILDLMEVLAGIDSVVSVATNYEILRKHLQSADEILGAVFIRYTKTRRALGDYPETELAPEIAARVEGIQRILNENDHGEYLRDYLTKNGGPRIKEVLKHRVGSDFGGRPEGMEPYRKYIGRRANELRAEYPKIQYKQMLGRIKGELLADHRAGKLTRGDAIEALNRLTSPTLSDPIGMVRRAFKEYKKVYGNRF